MRKRYPDTKDIASLPKQRVLVWPYEGEGDSARCLCPDGCTSPGKHPIGGPGAVVSDWNAHKGGVGISLDGSLLVIDVDPRNGGRETFAKLEETYGALPQVGPYELTGVDEKAGRGAHIYFQCPPQITSNCKLGPGVEIKVNGYVVCAPSPHPSGVDYKWVGPEESPVPLLPDSWVEKICENFSVPAIQAEAPTSNLPAYGERMEEAAAHIAQLEPSIAGEGGHDAAWLAAITVVRGYALDQSDAVDIFKAHFNHRCQPPWTDKEIIHKISQAAEKSTKAWGYEYGTLEVEGPEPELVLDKHGIPVKTVENLRLIYMTNRELVGRLAFNSRSEAYLIKPFDGSELRPLRDGDMFDIRAYLVREYGVQWSKEDVVDAAEWQARQNSFDPVELELRSYQWDGVERLGSWLVDYCGAEDTPLNREIGSVWLRGAVARALNPGCQMDYCLVLEGEQGIGKTSTLRILGGDHYIDSPLELGGNQKQSDVLRELYLGGAWIVELGELEALKGQYKRDSAIKQFLTQNKDVIRMLYARYPIIKPRSFVMAGTTNSSTYLSDTQNRRWLPVRVGQLDREGLARDRNALLAEAVLAYEANSGLVVASSLEAALNERRDERRDVRPDEEAVIEFLSGRSVVMMKDVYDVAGLKWDRRGSRYVGFLEAEGWGKAHTKKARYWVDTKVVTQRTGALLDAQYIKEQSQWMDAKAQGG